MGWEANDLTGGPDLVMNLGHVLPEVHCAYAKKNGVIPLMSVELLLIYAGMMSELGITFTDL